MIPGTCSAECLLGINIRRKMKKWNDYFMEIAEVVSTKATCNRKHVGAVIVKDKRILATGYNGGISGANNCDDVGHLIIENHCVRTVHAEVNAVTQCAKYGISCEGAKIYVNTFPCWNCFKTLVNSGIREIIYRDEYTSDGRDLVAGMAQDLGIILELWV